MELTGLEREDFPKSKYQGTVVKLTFCPVRSTSLQTGFLRLDGPPDKTVSASLLFRIMEGDYIKESVGIGPARAGTDFYIPIEDDDNVDTGIALAFLNEGEYSIRYVLYDDQGKVFEK